MVYDNFLALWFPLIVQFPAPRRALLLRRAVLVQVVELAAGEHIAAPLAVCFRLGSLNTPLNKARLLSWRAGRRRRSCLERLAQWRRRRIPDEVRGFALMNTTPPSRDSRQIEHCSMLAPARTPEVVQTLSETLKYDR